MNQMLPVIARILWNCFERGALHSIIIIIIIIIIVVSLALSSDWGTTALQEFRRHSSVQTDRRLLSADDSAQAADPITNSLESAV